MKKGVLVKRKIAELVFDFDLYPRGDIDSQNVSYLASAHQAGADLPPLVIDDPSNRIVDGFHRATMFRRVHGPAFEVECVAKRYGSEAEMFADAMRYNAPHGCRLDTNDRTRCLLTGLKLGMELELIANCLNMTVDKLGELRTERVGEMRIAGQSKQEIPLKRTIKHMAGKTLTKEQGEANDRLSGMNQTFYVNQIITLIENDLLDKSDEKLIERLDVLGRLIRKLRTG